MVFKNAMSKLYVAHGLEFIVLGLSLPTGHHKWIILSAVGVVVETIVFMAAYSLVI